MREKTGKTLTPWLSAFRARCSSLFAQALRLENEKLKTRLTRETRADEVLELEPEARRKAVLMGRVSSAPFAGSRC